MHLPSTIAVTIALAAPSLAQSSIEHTFVEFGTVTSTNAASPSNYFVSTGGPIPYPDITPSATVRPISISVFSAWTFDFALRYENQTSSVIDTFDAGMSQDGAMIFGDQNGVGLGCDSFFQQFGGSPVSVPPFGVFEDARQFEFTSCTAGATQASSAPIWDLMLNHLTNQLTPTFHGGLFELFPSTEPGMLTTASVSLTEDTEMTVVVELDEINPGASPQCGMGPNGQGAGAELRLYGSMVAGSSNLIARVDGVTPDQFMVLVATDSFVSVPAGPFNLCIAGNRLSQEIRFSTDTVEDFEVDLSNVMPGTTVAFQALYRASSGFGVSSFQTGTVQ